MKDLALILIMLASFILGYFLMVKIDSFIEENRRLTHTGNRRNRVYIRIAAGSPTLLDSISEQLAAYSRADPLVEFFLSSGKTERILQKLMAGAVDIAVLEEDAFSLREPFAMFRIPLRTAVPLSMVSVKNIGEEKWACVVWNKSMQSKARDRVLFAIEAEYCSVKCGYADYLE